MNAHRNKYIRIYYIHGRPVLPSPSANNGEKVEITYRTGPEYRASDHRSVIERWKYSRFQGRDQWKIGDRTVGI